FSRLLLSSEKLPARSSCTGQATVHGRKSLKRLHSDFGASISFCLRNEPNHDSKPTRLLVSVERKDVKHHKSLYSHSFSAEPELLATPLNRTESSQALRFVQVAVVILYS